MSKKVMGNKIIIVVLSLTLIAIGCFVLYYLLVLDDPSKSIKGFLKLILPTLATTLIATVIICFSYEWLIRNESVKNLKQSLLLDEDVLRDFFDKTNQLEDITKLAIGVKLNDKQMGNELYESFLSKVYSYEERYSNLYHHIILSRHPTQPDYFTVTTEYSYNTVLKKCNTIIFARTTENSELLTWHRLDCRDFRHLFNLRQ